MRLRRSASASSGLTIDRVDSEEKLNCGSSEKKASSGSCCTLFPTSEEGRGETGEGHGTNLLEELRLLRLVCVGSQLDALDGF